MDLKTKRMICLMVGIASILTIVGTISYAFFTTTGEMRKVESDINTGTVSARFADYGPEIGGELNFGDTVVKKFTIQNTGTVDASVKMYWKELINTYQEGSLTYTLSYSEEENGVYKDIVVDKDVPRSTNPSKKILKDILTIPVNKTYYYALSVTLNYLDDVNQDADLSASFNTSFDLVDSNYGQKVTLTFNPGSGTVSDNTLTIIDGEVESELPEPSLYGYSFRGWYLDEAYETQLTFAMLPTLKASQSVYAKWEPKEVTLTIDPQGNTFVGGGKTPKTVKVIYGQPYGTLPNLSLSCAKLKNWKIQGTDAVVSSSTIVSTEEDHTIYPEIGYYECFKAGTLIYTPNGYIPIEKLKVGDSVYSYNEKTKEIEESVITITFEHMTGKILEITLETGEMMEVTPEHPFYDKNTGEWKVVGEFKVGDYVMNDKGEAIKITSIVTKEQNVNVYNIEVDGNHDYFVTKSNVLVHNYVC